MHASVSTEWSVLAGSKVGEGKTIPAPEETQARDPRTVPKQWYLGRGVRQRGEETESRRDRRRVEEMKRKERGQSCGISIDGE